MVQFKDSEYVYELKLFIGIDREVLGEDLDDLGDCVEEACAGSLLEIGADVEVVTGGFDFQDITETMKSI